MKASVLIEQLQSLVDQGGDHDVLIDSGVDGGGLRPVAEVDLGEEDEGIILWPPDYALCAPGEMDPRD